MGVSTETLYGGCVGIDRWLGVGIFSQYEQVYLFLDSALKETTLRLRRRGTRAVEFVC